LLLVGSKPLLLPSAFWPSNVTSLETLPVAVLDPIAFFEVASNPFKDGNPCQMQEVSNRLLSGETRLDDTADLEKRLKNLGLKDLASDPEGWCRPRNRFG